MKTFLKIIVSAIVAVGLACVLVMFGYSANCVVATLFVSVLTACVLGVFDETDEVRDAKHATLKDAARYGEAA